MTSNRWTLMAALCVAFAAGVGARDVLLVTAVAQAPVANKVYELRTYVVPEDRLNLLHARFRNHTLRMFQKHNIGNVVYFSPQDPEKAKTTMMYLISHPSRQAADQNWKAFGSDPEWQAIAKESGVGPVKITREFLDPTDYSPLK
jgi:hypothetical protein